MCWLWTTDTDYLTWGADIDYGATYPMGGDEALSDTPVDPNSGTPLYRSNSGLKRFRKFHSPPFSPGIVVDKLWQDIILKFVPADRVQFYPVRLIARGEATEEFAWVIPFDRVRCIDMEHSEILDKTEKPGFLYIWKLGKFYHIPGCLGGLHLARDEYKLHHLLVSDELKAALEATGAGNLFHKPEETPERTTH